MPTCDINLHKLEFEFDLNGFAIVRNYLPPPTVDQLNLIVEGAGLASHYPKFHFVDQDEYCFNLIFDPLVMNLCSRWIGPTFRFDHAWGVHHPPVTENSTGKEGLHAGPYQNQGFFHYSWYNNRPRTSCIVFCYALKDQPASDGGLVLVPGSHKLNVPITDHPSRDIFERFYGRDLAKLETLVRPSLQKGDLIIMAEATIHGTARWRGTLDWRRNLYYKYCYGFMGWLPHDNDAIIRLRAKAKTDLQKRVLEPPYVSRTSGNASAWRLPIFADGTESSTSNRDG